MMKRTLAIFAGLALLAVPAMQAQSVDLELALLVDVSGSVDAGEFALQRDGYADFFSTDFSGFWDDFEAANRSMAVSFTYWSTGQTMMNDTWYHVTTAAEAYAFGADISGFGRSESNLTGPGSAINFIVPLFATNGFDGARQVIDVSGDGCENTGDDTSTASDNAGSIVINGLTIGTATADCGGSSLADWYSNNILHNGGFLESSVGFDDFGDAAARKIGREIVGSTVPEPATMTLLATGLAGIAAKRRRRKS